MRYSPKALPDDPEDFRATLVEHLDELRNRIIRIILLLAVGWSAGWFLEPVIYSRLEKSVTDVVVQRRPHLVYHHVFHNITDAFMLKLQLSFLIGVILALPFCILQLWAFVKPGLKPNERKPVGRIAPFSVLLFFMGAGFCYMILPSAIGWFTTYVDDFPDIVINQEAGKMVFFVLKMLLAFGLAFQLPLLVFLLGWIGILTPDTLLKYWRQSTVAIFSISMIITPSNDAFSMLMMAIPLTFLFIISVFLVKWTTKRRTALKERSEQLGSSESES
jgi:sec-independent protein translocase protein TatC